MNKNKASLMVVALVSMGLMSGCGAGFEVSSDTQLESLTEKAAYLKKLTSLAVPKEEAQNMPDAEIADQLVEFLDGFTARADELIINARESVDQRGGDPQFVENLQSEVRDLFTLVQRLDGELENNPEFQTLIADLSRSEAEHISPSQLENFGLEHLDTGSADISSILSELGNISQGSAGGLFQDSFGELAQDGAATSTLPAEAQGILCDALANVGQGFDRGRLDSVLSQLSISCP